MIFFKYVWRFDAVICNAWLTGCVDRTEPGQFVKLSGVWCGVSYCNIGTPHLTPAHQAVVYMQISQSALGQDIVNICCSPPTLLPRTLTLQISPPMLLLEWRYLIKDFPQLVFNTFKMTSLTSAAPELAVSHSQVLPSRSGRQMFGNSKEVDWAIGGAALGFTVAIVEYIANNVFER